MKFLLYCRTKGYTKQTHKKALKMQKKHGFFIKPLKKQKKNLKFVQFILHISIV